MTLNESIVREMVEVQGLSFSKIAKNYSINISSVSEFCKRYNIISKHMISITPKPLPIEEIYEKYIGGCSIYQLGKLYKAPPARIRKSLLKFKPDLVLRDSIKALKRPIELEDRSLFEELASKMSFRKIAIKLDVKPNTVCSAAKRFGVESRFEFTSDDIPKEKLNQLYNIEKKRISEIAEELGQSYNCVLRKIRKFGFDVASMGGVERPSRHANLNNRDWLYKIYIVDGRSMADIADVIGTSIGNISYYLKKYDIPIRSKLEYLKKLMTHGIKGEVNKIKVDSRLEADFLKSIDPEKKVLRNIELEYRNSVCFIDFCVEGEYVEVKPKEQSIIPGPNRKRLTKQWYVANKNDIDVKVWNGNYYSFVLEDLDVYYLVNWKLYFDSPDKCSDWLIKFGFHGVEFSRNECATWIAKADPKRVKSGNELNANYPNDDVLKLIKHFSPHYWYSSHKGYLPVSRAWDLGYHSVLKHAVGELWKDYKEVNIYGLVKYINKYIKDFSCVSIFKPWVARYIYEKYLPNGGLILDPCMGWGGRLLGCIDSKYDYYGIDLNKNSVDSHEKLAKFIKASINNYQFMNADSSVCGFPKADIVFTSPPYDDTERYYGIDSSSTVSQMIYENIFRKNNCLVVLNVPRRHSTICSEVAQKCGFGLVEELQMKTSSFMGREKTYEPILVFRKS